MTGLEVVVDEVLGRLDVGHMERVAVATAGMLAGPGVAVAFFYPGDATEYVLSFVAVDAWSVVSDPRRRRPSGLSMGEGWFDVGVRPDGLGPMRWSAERVASRSVGWRYVRAHGCSTDYTSVVVAEFLRMVSFRWVVMAGGEDRARRGDAAHDAHG
ncbi:MAG: hypothetical protein GY925_22295 [Actinomycetia bacterium]|nr:hypothetical protein [Actinomycetes bacterium]